MKKTEIKKKNIIGIRIIAAILMLILVSSAFVFAADENAVKCRSGVLVTPIGDLEAEAPELAARSAAMYSLDMERFVYEKDADKKIDPYSTTKILTCWLALENLDPQETVTISEAATREYENGMTIYLKPGEKIAVIDLIYAAMLASGNDAAYALGEAVAGSESAFADLMNETVKSWGCNDTHFVNANGWKNDEHYTTVRDMAIITAKCLENKQLGEISMEKTHVIPATNMTEARELKNYFRGVMGNTKNLFGGKSGTWDDDDCGAVAGFRRKGLSEVIVVLGDTEKGRPKDVRSLIEFSHDVTPGFAVPAEGSTVETAWIRHGEKTKAALTVDKVTYAYPHNNTAGEITTEVVYNKLEAPLRKGDEVGDFIVYVGDKVVGEHKLIMAEDIETGWLPSYLYISNKVTKMILGVLAAMILLILLLRIINRNRRRKRVALKKKYSGKGTEPRPSGDGSNDSRSSSGNSGRQSAKDKREARKRLREKYRAKH